jgi:hypothetical protein
MSAVAGASLPVAVGLLVLAGGARALLWAPVEDEQARRLGHQYLEPLSTWCVVAVGVHLLALTVAGETEVLALLLPLGTLTGALLLRPSAEQTDDEPSVLEPQEQPAAPVVAPVTRVAAAPASLWAGVDRD